MSETDRSECPGFKRAWDININECKDCARVFQDEYAVCRKYSQEPAKPVVKAVVNPNFIPFRLGSRADILHRFLKEMQGATIQEAADHLVRTCRIENKIAEGNVRDYCYEWERGMWSNIKKDFPFKIVIENDKITYQEKGVK